MIKHNVESERGISDTIIEQFKIVETNPVLEFGPIRVTLKELFDDGYRLEAVAPYPPRPYETIKIKLRKDEKSFLYGHVKCSQLMNANDLGGFRRRADRDTTYAQIHSIPDLWKTLEERYPNRAKPIKIGNHTLREYVEERLSA